MWTTVHITPFCFLCLFCFFITHNLIHLFYFTPNDSRMVYPTVLTLTEIDKLAEQAWNSQDDLSKMGQLLIQLKEQCEATNYSFGLACYHCTLASYHSLK